MVKANKYTGGSINRELIVEETYKDVKNPRVKSGG